VEQALLGIAVAVTVVAALRSTWSPCGVSMLSTITPLAERAKGHRYGRTAGWFLVGATLGGATLGLATAALAAGVAALGTSTVTALALVAGLAGVGALSDARLGGFRLPGHTRQVNELWFGEYRPWVYAGGFGWQIGVGLATFITTAAVYLTIAAAALTGRPLAALALGTLFGLVRGLAVFAGFRLTHPDALLAFHRRFDALAEPTRWLVVAFQVVVVAVAGAVAFGPVPGFVAAALLAAVLALGPKAGAGQPLAAQATAGPTSLVLDRPV
jgi:hypothetical protein